MLWSGRRLRYIGGVTTGPIRSCPGCGAATPVDAGFCGSCGAALGGGGERRVSPALVVAAVTAVVALLAVLGAGAYFFLGGFDPFGDGTAGKSHGSEASKVEVGEILEAHVASAAISGGQGGSLTLPDGASLSLPAGSLSKDGTVRMRKLLPGLPDRQTVVFYDITVDGAELSGTATL